MNDEQISQLAADFRGGNQGSFRILVESQTSALLATAYRYTRNWESARDLTQETWIRVYERIDSYDPARPFRPWLTTIHRNGCLNPLKKSIMQREVTTDPQTMEQLPGTAQGTDPQELLKQKEVAHMLRMSFPTLRTTLHFARKRLAGLLCRMEEAPWTAK